MIYNLFETDVYRDFDRGGAAMTNKVKAIITNPDAATIVNEMLAEPLDVLRRTFKEPIVVKALTEVSKGNLVLFVAKPEFNLPPCLPFFRYKNAKTGETKVAINMTNVVTEMTGKDQLGANTGEIVGYAINDVNVTYTMLIAAYIQLKVADPSMFNTKVLSYGAILWARMFNKILVKTIGLANNRERYDAYFYFAVRFFLIYYIGAPLKTVDSISASVMKDGKTPLIISIEDKVNSMGINMYADFTSFCQTLFNNEISNVKASRIVTANPNEQINVSFYCRKFIDSYHQGAILGLASVYYFIWIVLAVQMKARLFNIKMCEDIFSKTEMANFLNGVYASAS